MKNSEWGAVAYLTESKYGRNGTKVSKNSSSAYYTGGGNGTSYVSNTLQSSTGNIYGIYDLSGSANEYLAAYCAESTSSYLTDYGGKLVSENKSSNAYSTAYIGTTASSGYIYGDATYETSGWNGNSTDFIGSSSPFFMRGGYHGDNNAGIFGFGKYGGGADGFCGFRISLVV